MRDVFEALDLLSVQDSYSGPKLFVPDGFALHDVSGDKSPTFTSLELVCTSEDLLGVPGERVVQDSPQSVVGLLDLFLIHRVADCNLDHSSCDARVTIGLNPWEDLFEAWRSCHHVTFDLIFPRPALLVPVKLIIIVQIVESEWDATTIDCAK